MQKSSNTDKPMSKKCKLDAHNRLRRDNWRLSCHAFSNLITVCTNRKDKGTFWSVRLLSLRASRIRADRQGLKKWLLGFFFNHNSSCECNACSKRRRHAARSALVAQKSGFRTFFRPNCIESMARSHIGRRNPSGSSS